MKLPIPFLKPRRDESDYYLTLILTDEKAGAVILKAEDGKLKRINSHEAFFSDSLEELSLDELINTIDKAISRAEEILPPDIQTHQTVFGVRDNWVDEETKKIKKEYLEKLKKVCDALDLKPIGFMVTTEAIMHLMQEEEGAPVSAVFAEVNKKDISLSLIRGGKVIESVGSPHLESTPATVDKLLGHFTVPVLPARIVIFQSKPNEHTSQAFIAHHWSKHLPFLHVPQVTALPSAFDMRSVMFGAATQMNYTIDEGAHEELRAVTQKVAHEEEEFAKEEVVESPEIADTVKQPADFGETTGKLTDEAVPNDFGFVMDQDIPERSQHIPLQRKESLEHRADSIQESPGEEDSYELSRRQKNSEEEKGSLLATVTSFKLPKKFKLPAAANLVGFLKKKQTPMHIIVPVIVVIILIVGIIFFYYYKMQANVILTMKPNTVNQDQTVTFSTSQSNDFGSNLIAAKSVSASVNGQVSTPATGKKDEGTKAKGTVTIYNNNSNSVSLDGGATLTASNGQVFLLDNSVQVASASGDIFSGTKPGTTNATVTAKDIGTDSNVPSGTAFTIGGDNTVAAKNDAAFSGGAKKTVTVVSASDIAKLRSDLLKSIQDASKQKLSEQSSGGEAVLPLVSSTTLQDQKFDHHVGDQASQVTLTATVVSNGLAYATSDLDDYAKSIVKQKYPQDPTVANNSVKETISDASQKTKDSAVATVSIQAGILPNIDKQDIISNIQTKSYGDAKNSLTSLPQVDKADISFSPPIPLLPLLFPTLPHHISVTITQ